MEKTGSGLFIYAESENSTRNLNLANNKYKDLKVIIFRTIYNQHSSNENLFMKQCEDLNIDISTIDLSELTTKAGLHNENMLILTAAHSVAVEWDIDTLIINLMNFTKTSFKYRHIVNLQSLLNSNTGKTISIDKTILI